VLRYLISTAFFNAFILKENFTYTNGSFNDIWVKGHYNIVSFAERKEHLSVSRCLHHMSKNLINAICVSPPHCLAVHNETTTWVSQAVDVRAPDLEWSELVRSICCRCYSMHLNYTTEHTAIIIVCASCLKRFKDRKILFVMMKEILWILKLCYFFE